MEQNPVSDEELLKLVEVVVHGCEARNVQEEDEQLENSSAEKFHDVSDSADFCYEGLIPENKNYKLESQILASQLEAEKRKSKDLQSKFELLENSVKHFERLSGQLATIKQTVEEDMRIEQGTKGAMEAMQKLRPKTVHTTPSGKEEPDETAANSGEPQADDGKIVKPKSKNGSKEEVSFRDAEDFKLLDEGLEIVKDKDKDVESNETEKVFITKTEKRCLEDIGHIASRTRAPLDDKHQRYFEKDRKKFANRITMPETQEIDRTESVPAEIISKTKETPVNITSTELDGLRSYLLQLKELIASRETAWARTTERDYNQRVEITRFKNEVSHLRMLCEKRQRDVKERDQIIAMKDDEIKDLQKRVQALKNAVMKLEKKDERIMDTLDGLTNEVLENSQLVQRSYNVMKRSSLLKGNTTPSSSSAVAKTGSPKSKETKRPHAPSERSPVRRVKPTPSNTVESESRVASEKSRMRLGPDRSKSRSRPEASKDTMEKMDENLQRIEEMLHAEVLKAAKKQTTGWKPRTGSSDLKTLIRNHNAEKGTGDVDPNFQKKVTPSNSKMRQEMLGAMAGMNTSIGLGARSGGFLHEAKKQQGKGNMIASALFSARSTNLHY